MSNLHGELKHDQRAVSWQRTDSGALVIGGRSYTSDQMQGRSAAMVAAAHFLQTQAQQLTEAEALAADLLIEAAEWAKRAKRCCDALSPGQRRTYEQLQAHLANHGRSPTMVELAEFDKVSTSTIQIRIRALVKKGFVCKAANVRGGLSITDAARGGEPGWRPL